MLNRYDKIIKEMHYRGFKTNYTCQSLIEYVYTTKNDLIPNIYRINDIDMNISKERIKERYNMKKEWYRWTKRDKPDWL